MGTIELFARTVMVFIGTIKLFGGAIGQFGATIELFAEAVMFFTGASEQEAFQTSGEGLEWLKSWRCLQISRLRMQVMSQTSPAAYPPTTSVNQ